MAYTTINKSTDYFNTKIYTGNGSTNAQTGVGFEPSLTWLKARSYSDSHALYDAVRGVTKRIQTTGTTTEGTVANSLTSFNSDGFTLGSDGQANSNNDTYASWNWRAGTSSGISAGSQTIYPGAYSINTTAGFGIYKYLGNGTAGATISHGLGDTVDFVIVNGLDNNEAWQVISKGMDADKFIQINADAQISQGSYNMFNSTRPSSTVVTLGNQNHTNANGQNYIMYCFASKTGFSKFGSYTGNGSSDGTFVYTGFKPAFVMVKRTDNTNHWAMYDNKRNGFNDENNYLRAEGNYAEGNETWGDLDILSNGFKPRAVDGMHNASGGTYIYIAFAEAPLVGTNNVPCTAR